jgi:hypothetical protein
MDVSKFVGLDETIPVAVQHHEYASVLLAAFRLETV